MNENTPVIHIAPWMHIVTPGGGVPLGELLPTAGHVFVARADGRTMTDETMAFQALQESLRFPGYFGWTWDSLYDCLRDLQWLDSDHHVLVIENADDALPEEGDVRRLLFRTLWRAGERWSYVKRPEGLTLSRLSVVLDCPEESASHLSELLADLHDQAE